jgi:hypothetical protein
VDHPAHIAEKAVNPSSVFAVDQAVPQNRQAKSNRRRARLQTTQLALQLSKSPKMANVVGTDGHVLDLRMETAAANTAIADHQKPTVERDVSLCLGTVID